jgi:plasmid stabilization system protein ParE
MPHMSSYLKIIAFCAMLVSQPVLALELINVENSAVESAEDTLPANDDASGWQPFSGRVLKSGGSQWFRIELTLQLEKNEQVHNPLALGVSLRGVYEFYWDGELVGSNHDRGADANRLSRVFIPVRSLAKGRHVILMRITPIGLQHGESLDLDIRPAAVKADFFGIHPTLISTFFVATAGTLIGCYLLLLWYSGNRRSGLWQAIAMSFTAVALILLEEGQYLFSYPYGWQPVLDQLIPPLFLVIVLLLPWFTFTRLDIKHYGRWTAAIVFVVAALLIGLGKGETDLLLLVGLSASLLALSGYALWKGNKAAKLYVPGFALALVSLVADPEQKHLFLIVVILLLAFELALDIRRQALETIRHALASERLRADLIKRNIQPHFLMNSLTALMEWVETSPEAAVDFIDGLAHEFRLLADFAERQSVSLGEELALCEIHIRLMAQRLDGRFAFNRVGVDEDRRIPPGIFHTLLENAFSHNNYAEQDVAFELAYEGGEGVARYILKVPASSHQAPSMGTGAGTRYVRARLEEFCGNAFSFTSEQVGSYWMTTIEIGSFER